MNSSYPSFISENSNRTFPLCFHKDAVDFGNNKLLGFRAFSKKALKDAVSLVRIISLPPISSTQSYLLTPFYKHLSPGHTHLFFELFCSENVSERLVCIKFPNTDIIFPKSVSVSGAMQNGKRLWAVKVLVGEGMLEYCNIDEVIDQSPSNLVVEPSQTVYVGEVGIDSLKVVKPDKTVSTGNLIVSECGVADVDGRYVINQQDGGFPIFRKEGAPYVIEYSGGQWKIVDTIFDEALYTSSSTDSLPADGLTWQSASFIFEPAPSVSQEVGTFSREIVDRVRFLPGINTTVIQEGNKLVLRSSNKQGLGGLVYEGTDPGVCDGIISVNGVTGNEERVLIIRGKNGIVVRDDPDTHTVFLKIDPTHKASKCPPYIKIVDAYIVSEQPDINTDPEFYAVFQVKTFSKLDIPIDVTYETLSDTALPPTNYESQSGTIQIGAGSPTKEIRVRIYKSEVPTQNSIQFFVGIDAPSPAVVTRNIAVAQWID